MKYRNKHTEIEAFRLDDRGLIGEDWFWDAVSDNRIITHDFGKRGESYGKFAWCEIKTLEGTMIARSGDYIIRVAQGEIYPCNADIFKQMYEPVAKVCLD